MRITSPNNQVIKTLMKLKTKKYRDEEKKYLVDGRHMVQEALDANLVEMVITTDDSYVSDQKVLYVSETIMEKLSFTKTPQPYMAVVRKREDTLINCERTLIFDGVQDPGNIGTMMRSACAFGFKQVIFSHDSCDLYNDKTLRSTQGAIFKINTYRGDLKKIIPKLKKQGVKVIGSALQEALPIDQIQSIDQMAFVMGNEGKGMRKETLDLCDEALYIPIGDMESLNVGVAAGIIMYNFKRVNK